MRDKAAHEWGTRQLRIVAVSVSQEVVAVLRGEDGLVLRAQRGECSFNREDADDSRAYAALPGRGLGLSKVFYGLWRGVRVVIPWRGLVESRDEL